MPGLPATGELSYNGYEFDGASTITASVEYMYDEAHRTVISHIHTIKVVAVIANDNGLDDDLTDIRKRLGESGRKLKFINKGFGDDLLVGRTSDVKNGPFPKILSWSSLGDDRAAQIEWEVAVTVPVCLGGLPHFKGVMAINYGIEYRIDQHGDTTRTLSGYIEIAQEATGISASDTADRYRNRFAPAGLSGFTRQQTWSLSFDKSRIDFAITDTQIPSPNPYPQGITDISASHRQSWRRGRGGAQFLNTISARITPEAGLSGAQAWQVFLTIVIQRMAHAKARGQSVFLDSLDVEEGLFSRTHNFSVTYRMLSSIRDFIGDSGMWTPIGTNWDLWRASLTRSTFSSRGHAQLRDIAANDIIVNLCGTAPTISPNNLQEFRFKTTPVSPGLKNERPKPEKSFFDYGSYIMPYRDQPVVRQSILDDVLDSFDLNWLIQPAQDPPPDGFDFGAQSGRNPDVIQQGGSGSYGITIAGRAKRAGYEIARPSILKVGDTDVVEKSAKFVQRVVGDFFDVPVYEAMWVVDYIVPKSPGRVTPYINEGEKPS